MPIGRTLDLYFIQLYMSQHSDFPLKEILALLYSIVTMSNLLLSQSMPMYS